jgi:hypothetical protein
MPMYHEVKLSLDGQRYRVMEVERVPFGDADSLPHDEIKPGETFPTIEAADRRAVEVVLANPQDRVFLFEDGDAMGKMFYAKLEHVMARFEAV